MFESFFANNPAVAKILSEGGPIAAVFLLWIGYIISDQIMQRRRDARREKKEDEREALREKRYDDILHGYINDSKASTIAIHAAAASTANSTEAMARQKESMDRLTDAVNRLPERLK